MKTASTGFVLAAMLTAVGVRADIVNDGGFEAGAYSDNWAESSTNFGSPLCDGGCSQNPDFIAHGGVWWVWFGGIDAFEEAAVVQEVDIPQGTATLSFYLWTSHADALVPGEDFVEATIDGTQVFAATDQDDQYYPDYQLVQVDITPFAGALRTLAIHSQVNGGEGLFTNFFVDDVTLDIAGGDCYADLDGSGTLDLFDFLAFVNVFNAKDGKGDCDANQAFDLFDFLCFVNAFNAGC